MYLCVDCAGVNNSIHKNTKRFHLKIYIYIYIYIAFCFYFCIVSDLFDSTSVWHITQATAKASTSVCKQLSSAWLQTQQWSAAMLWRYTRGRQELSARAPRSLEGDCQAEEENILTHSWNVWANQIQSSVPSHSVWHKRTLTCSFLSDRWGGRAGETTYGNT